MAGGPTPILAPTSGSSGPSAHERVKKLEARGVIRGYAASVDPAAAGYGITAFSWLTQAPGTPGTDLTDAFAADPEVEECHHIAGEADYLLKIRARDTRHLEAVIVRLQGSPASSRARPTSSSRPTFERRPLRLADADETDGPGPA